MVPGYVIFGIFLIVLYGLIHENSQFAATASVIRQVWSGECRLSCRQSALSDGRTSGLSGLVESYREEEARAAQCICEACPCALIENFLTSCRPATNLYTNTVGFLVSIVMGVINSLVSSVTNYNSNEDFTLVDEKPKMRLRPKVHPSSSSATAPTASAATSAKTFDFDRSKYSDDSSFSAPKSLSTSSESKSSTASIGVRTSVPTIRESAPSGSILKQPPTPTNTQIFSDDTLQPTSSEETREEARLDCSKCVETGKTCVGGCPNAERRRRQI
ncbi:unnamed protein product [Chrysodeixis includens]|uniref:Uncharacterized protein n=1 Tax=Chrysodeixis includens TaxID=689277 RepID=A0A9N8KWY0_CHRIL|nr:unnamed protein product [Chrysodeixis includens]